MKIFESVAKNLKPRDTELYAVYELAYTAVDLFAAIFFIIGSVLFFREETAYWGTWMYLIGSILFALKPGIHLIREVHLLRVGRYEKLGKQAKRDRLVQSSD